MPSILERYVPFALAAIVALAVAAVVFSSGKIRYSYAIPAAAMTFGIVVAGFSATQRNMLLGMRGSSVLRFLSRTMYYNDVLNYFMQGVYTSLLVSAISVVGFFVDSNPLIWKIWIVMFSYSVTQVLLIIGRNEILMGRIIRRFLEDSNNDTR